MHYSIVATVYKAGITNLYLRGRHTDRLYLRTAALRPCPIERDAVVTTIGGIKSTIITTTVTVVAITTIAITGIATLVAITVTLVRLIFLLLLLVSSSTYGSTDSSTASHTHNRSDVMATPSTRDASYGRA